MRRTSRAVAGAATSLLAIGLIAAACAPRMPRPSQAILEARQRAKVADQLPKCLVLGPTADVPFVFGAAELTDEARARLDQVVAWAACTKGAQVSVTIDDERHYRQPEKEQAILEGRRSAVRGYLGQRLAAGVLLAEGATADPARASLTVRGRGW